MNHLTLPMLVFVVIEWVAYVQGMTSIATLALSGAFLCLGLQIGWRAWGRANRKGGKDA